LREPLPGSLSLGVLDPFLWLSFQRSQDLVALPRLLLMLLEIIQPKRRIGADKNEQKSASQRPNLVVNFSFTRFIGGRLASGTAR
jgi:hypothetical protein